jgi:uncharacterized protein YeaO (DUF488 family)
MKRTKVTSVEVQRVYDRKPQPTKTAFLVDRLWPRGIKKEALGIKAWIREVGPSDSLRHWFGHDPDKWPEFKRRYFHELKQNSEALRPLLEAVQMGPVTLLFAAKDSQHNNAVALREFLLRHPEM